MCRKMKGHIWKIMVTKEQRVLNWRNVVERRGMYEEGRKKVKLGDVRKTDRKGENKRPRYILDREGLTHERTQGTETLMWIRELSQRAWSRNPLARRNGGVRGVLESTPISLPLVG